MPLLENIHGETTALGQSAQECAAEYAAADDADSAPQRAQAGSGRRRLRVSRSAARSDQGHRARTGAMTAMSRPAGPERDHASHPPPDGRADDVPTVPERGDSPFDRAREGSEAGIPSLPGVCPEGGACRCRKSPPSLPLDAVVQSLDRRQRGRAGGRAAPRCHARTADSSSWSSARAGGWAARRITRSFPRGSWRSCSDTTAPPATWARRRGGARGPRTGSGCGRRLREAVSREDYEEAARLRDLLRPGNHAHDS